MSLVDRDYPRTPPPRRTTSPVALLVVCAAVALFVWTGAAGWTIDSIRSHHGNNRIGWAASVGPGVTFRAGLLLPDDPWKSFLAPDSVCPGGADSSASPAAQQDAAICLLNYARAREGLSALPSSLTLSEWSASKAADIVRCDEFSHTPCGEAGNRYPLAAGFTGAFGENIFLGPQVFKTPLAAVDGWLNSEDHRANLFRTGWRSQGIAVAHIDHLRNQRDVAIWVSEFST